MWLEYQEPGRFRLVIEPMPPHGADTGQTTEQGLRLAFDQRDWDLLRTAPARQMTTLAEFDLALRAARLATHAGFDRLICLPLVRDMELLEHQIRTAKTVLRRFRGRALLCDEVGLGKTIEAGLILAELVDARPGPLGAGAGAAVADRAVAGRDAAQVLARADQPRRPGLPRSAAPPPGASSTA